VNIDISAINIPKKLFKKENYMEKIPQKLDKTRKGYYANAPVSKFAERKAEFNGLGRIVKNKNRGLRDVVCVEVCRTPYGTFNGSLREFSAPNSGHWLSRKLYAGQTGK
jgi:acetyl-CoA C-acetyltransferase